MTANESKNPINRFLRDFGFYTIADVIPSAVGVVALVVFTHIYNSTAYGRYSLTFVFVTVISTLAFGWIRQSALRYESESGGVTETTLWLLIGATTLVVGVGVIGYLIIAPQLGQFKPFYLAGMAALVATGVFKVGAAIYQARLKPRLVMKVKILNGSLKHILGLGLSVFVFGGIVGWVWGIALAGFIGIGAMVALHFEFRTINFNRDTAVRMLKYGIPMMGWLFGLTLLTFIDRVLLEFLETTAAVGVYSANYRIVQAGLTLVLSPIIDAAHPVIMDEWNDDNHSQVKGLITNYSRLFLILGVPAAIFAATISRPLSQIMLGTEYHTGFVVIPIIAASLFLWYLSMLGHKGLEVKDETGIMTAGVGIAVVANVLFNFILIPSFSYIGAAVATLLSSAVYLVFAYVTSIRTVSWTIPLSTVSRTLFAGSVMAGIGAIGYSISSLPRVAPVAAGVFGGVLYFALLLPLGEFSGEELEPIYDAL